MKRATKQKLHGIIKGKNGFKKKKIIDKSCEVKWVSIFKRIAFSQN